MRYFVIGDDGQKYGPADIPTLQGWIREGRLLPTQQLEDEASGTRTVARAVNGLEFPPDFTAPGNPNVAPQGSPYQQGTPYQQGYPRAGQPVGDTGQNDLTLAWVFGVLGLFFCCILDIPAIIFANRAYEKGNPGGNAVRIFCFVVLGIQVVGIIGYIILVAMAVKSGAVPGQPRMQFHSS